MSVENVLKVSCTDYHLEYGAPANTCFCPLAMAITAKVEGVAEVFHDGKVEIRSTTWKYVDLKTGMTRRHLKFRRDQVLKTGRLNDQAIAWMHSYDTLGKGLPIDFEVTFS